MALKKDPEINLGFLYNVISATDQNCHLSKNKSKT
jgi:hypothetical protein